VTSYQVVEGFLPLLVFTKILVNMFFLSLAVTKTNARKHAPVVYSCPSTMLISHDLPAHVQFIYWWRDSGNVERSVFFLKNNINILQIRQRYMREQHIHSSATGRLLGHCGPNPSLPRSLSRRLFWK